MLKRQIRYIKRFLYSFRRPVMLIGYWDTKGNYLPWVRISSSTYIDYPEHLVLGDNIFIAHHNNIEASNGVSIGEGCQIASFVTITSHSSHHSLRLYGSSYAGPDMIGYIKGRIEIGRYTFIGPHVTIMPNTSIGEGCIIASHSYVEGNFPDFSIIGGVPAKIIGSTKDKDDAFLNEFPELRNTYMK